MKVAVRSSGVGRDFDYSWKGDKLPEFDSIKHLIESESPSVVIKSQQEKLLLVVTGVKSNRTDFSGRVIRNSVVWLVTKNPESEKGLRRLASRALKGEMNSELDQLIVSSENQDFEFDEVALKELASTTGNIDDQKLDKLGMSNQVAKAERNNKIELAKEIEKYRLPNRDGVLVVVTGVKSENTLKESGVWRGLSLNVASDEFESYEIKSSDFMKAIIIIAVIMIALALFLILKPQICSIFPQENQLSYFLCNPW